MNDDAMTKTRLMTAMTSDKFSID